MRSSFRSTLYVCRDPPMRRFLFLLRNPGGRLGSSRGSTQVDLYGMVLGLGLAAVMGYRILLI